MKLPSSRAALCIAALIVVGAVLGAQAAFTLPGLDYPPFGLEDGIDTETVKLHHDKHFGASVDNLNRALSQTPEPVQKLALTQLLQQVGSLHLPANVTSPLRNNGGSTFNHAMYFKTMRPKYYDQIPAYPKNRPSKHLSAAVAESFYSYDKFKAAFKDAALNRVFGSSWTWLCYNSTAVGPKLAIVSLPNQDNPLMTHIVGADKQCTPILGIDMFEHAYYLKHRNVRANYVDSWWTVVDWTRVSQNLKFAVKGDLEALWN